VQFLESFPVQINILVRGMLPDACSFIESIAQKREAQTFRIALNFARHPDARCAPVLTPFEQIVPLDVLGLPAGTYNIEVNGDQVSFVLPEDNIPPPVGEPGGWSCADVGRPDPCNNWLFGVDMLSSEEGWAVGLSGTILHIQGGEIDKATSPTNESLRAVDMLSQDDGWIVGEEGTILRWNGQAWTVVDSPTNNPLLAVDMLSENDGWAVGVFGTMLRWNGQAWTEVLAPVELDLLQAVELVSPDEGWAVGADSTGAGVILHWDGEAWREFPAIPLPTGSLLDLEMLSA
jgi:hypothetical protein